MKNIFNKSNNTKHSGLAHVRRVVLEEASGDYLWFVDVDDEIEEGANRIYS